MRVNYLTPEQLSEVLSPGRLNLPKRPRVVEIKVEEVEDWSGEDSLEVFIILDPKTSNRMRTLKYIRPIEQEIRRALRAAGETRFPYMTAYTREQYDRRYSYNPSED